MGMMGRILGYGNVVVRLAKFPTVTVESNTGDNKRAEYFQSSGDDSPPLNGDNIALIGQQRQGGWQAVGVIDHRNSGLSAPGEKRIYSRDDAGAVKAELYIKKDGSCTLKNSSGTYQLDISAAGAAVLTLSSSLTVSAADATVNCNTRINGDLFIDGGVTYSGTAQGDGGPAQFSGGINNAGGDIVSDGISLETHVHSGVTPGGSNTGGPV